MALLSVVAMVRKDLQLFMSDRRAVLMTFALPFAIASFFGAIFSGPQNSEEVARIPVLIDDQDGSSIAKAILAGVQSDRNLSARTVAADEARDEVRRGRATVGILIPPGFGDAAGRAFFSGAEKPQLHLLYDPSRAAELGMVRGILIQHVMEAVSGEMFGGERGRQIVAESLAQIDNMTIADEQKRLLRDMLTSVQKFYATDTAVSSGRPPGLNMPYSVREEPVTSRTNVVYNGYAHSFAGMGVQFVLFAAIELGIGILLERQLGLWERLRSAPISRFTLLAGKMASGAIIGLMTLLVSFGLAILVWGVRIHGSLLGFLGVAVACSLMASTFGLLIAAIGRTPNATRSVAIFATLIMVMLGGAWVPTFIFPAWLQQLTIVVPTRWAVDGLEAMTWRGLDLPSALPPIVVLLGFAAAFGILALARFRWEEA